ncbi:MAG: geranylgeranylglycerol-phosphate geranylgeranyltransferase [Prevotellaceae bacterium]|jgi:4-hydroxybenzoate polyprenyltransferase|nr:geranylgeranylglycerol-phosphate geranylgeranyltransferase [Prevotellaceae bacterium]
MQNSSNSTISPSGSRGLSDYLRLIRLPNLVFLAFIQLLINRSLLMPILQTFGFDTSGNSMLNITLLIFATALIAAGGYALNDYFDIKIDAINKPSKQIVGKSVSRQTAMLLHQILTITGVCIGLFLSFLTRSFSLAFVFIVVPGLLWFYSSNYKRQFVTGNLVVAFNAALSILVVAIMELAVLQRQYGDLIFGTAIPRTFYTWTGGFALFAFLCTWIREIIKDMEDEGGDREMECRTMPIKWGWKRTKGFLYGLIGLGITGLFAANSLIPFEGSLSFRYIVFGCVFPFVALAYLVFRATTPEDFHQASILSKVIMLTGTLYCLIFYFLTAQASGIKIFNLFLVNP